MTTPPPPESFETIVDEVLENLRIDYGIDYEPSLTTDVVAMEAKRALLAAHQHEIDHELGGVLDVAFNADTQQEIIDYIEERLRAAFPPTPEGSQGPADDYNDRMRRREE